MTDGDELEQGTDPLSPDTDGDGVNDADDGLPLNPNETEDTDGDGVGNNADTDDDNDGLSDQDETANNTDPENPDCDGDGLLDGDEIAIGLIHSMKIPMEMGNPRWRG